MYDECVYDDTLKQSPSPNSNICACLFAKKCRVCVCVNVQNVCFRLFNGCDNLAAPTMMTTTAAEKKEKFCKKHRSDLNKIRLRDKFL